MLDNPDIIIEKIDVAHGKSEKHKCLTMGCFLLTTRCILLAVLESFEQFLKFHGCTKLTAKKLSQTELKALK